MRRLHSLRLGVVVLAVDGIRDITVFAADRIRDIPVAGTHGVGHDSEVWHLDHPCTGIREARRPDECVVRAGNAKEIDFTLTARAAPCPSVRVTVGDSPVDVPRPEVWPVERVAP